jgi:hypothetical protein
MNDAHLKLVALLFAVALPATATADALGLHDCPHHDAVPSAPSDTGHGAHGDHAVGEQDGESQHGEHGPCTCVGTCQAGGTLSALAVRGGAFQIASPVESVDRTFRADGAQLPPAPAFLLPYPLGPPAHPVA